MPLRYAVRVARGRAADDASARRSCGMAVPRLAV